MAFVVIEMLASWYMMLFFSQTCRNINFKVYSWHFTCECVNPEQKIYGNQFFAWRNAHCNGRLYTWTPELCTLLGHFCLEQNGLFWLVNRSKQETAKDAGISVMVFVADENLRRCFQLYLQVGNVFQCNLICKFSW